MQEFNVQPVPDAPYAPDETFRVSDTFLVTQFELDAATQMAMTLPSR